MRILSFLTVLLTFFIFVSNTQAKVLPQAQKATASSNAFKKVGSGINVSALLRADRRALNVYFSNLQNASFVSYLLTYQQNGQDEGARGTLTLDKSSTSQELLFGTCSKGVCRYHSNISNAKLEVSYGTKTGKKYLKRFRIRV